MKSTTSKSFFFFSNFYIRHCTLYENIIFAMTFKLVKRTPLYEVNLTYFEKFELFLNYIILNSCHKTLLVYCGIF